jgi:gamma-glutamyltranspeptidase/glutathione hydrolase
MPASTVTLKLSLLPLVLLLCLSFPAAAREPAPEAATGFRQKAPVVAQTNMVVAAHPLAVQAGEWVLARGGNAIDAAIAVQLVLNLVEPQSSGIGGGAFMLYYDAAQEELFSYDGRETAPAAATPGMFLGEDGEPIDFYQAVVGGKSVGVPGLLRMLEMAHARHGELEWELLFAPAIKLAEEGFPISHRLHELLARDRFLPGQEAARRYFYRADGRPRAVGEILRNPQLAQVLRRVAVEGSEVFYQGEIARDIVAAVLSHPTNPGLLTLADLAGYRAIEREPVCGPYRAYLICGVPPPTSGGVTTLQMLGILEHFNLARLPPLSVEAVHLIAEAGRLAYADRDRYLADPAFVEVPAGRWSCPPPPRSPSSMATATPCP